MRATLIVICVGAWAALLPTPGLAQSIGDRLERIFGPPVSENGAAPARRATRSDAPARRTPTPPDPEDVPLPLARPDEAASAADSDEAEDPALTESAPVENDAATAPDEDAGPVEPEGNEADTGGEASPAAAAQPEPEAAEAGPGERGQPDAPDENVPAPQDVPTPAPAERPEEGAADDAAVPPAGETAADEAEPSPEASERDSAPGAAPTGDETEANDAGEDGSEAEDAEPKLAPAYVSPEKARTVPEPAAPDVEPAGVTPDASVEAAAAVEDAEACEAELRERGAEFTVGASVADGVCGVLRPIQLTRFSAGTAMAPETQMLCRTALALDVWVSEALVPASREHLRQEAPKTLRHASTYVCRDRASESGLSEHGKGSAVDIGSLEWPGRAPIRIEAHPAGSPEDRFLADIRRAACGPFRTVLGPGTDADHADHFHFDIAARSNESTYCR